MSQLQTFIDPTSTSQLLSNLSRAIDETKLLRTISSVQSDIYKIESVSGPSMRTRFLRRQLKSLENQLELVRNQFIIHHHTR